MGENQDDVQIHNDKAVQEVLEYVIDQDLEYSLGVSDSEQHPQVFKVMVRVPQVQFSEDCCTMQRLKAELKRGRRYLFFMVIGNQYLNGGTYPFLAMKKNLAPRGEEECHMMLAARESLMYFSMASLRTGQVVQSTGCQSGPGKVCGAAVHAVR